MHLNSNDIFSQIGLVVTNQEQSSQNLHYYTVYLEIELSQGNNQLLQIRQTCIDVRNYDDPHDISLKFCRKHKLNELAVQIVENKIREAKNKQEKRMRDNLKNRSRDSSSLAKSSFQSKHYDNDKFQESLSRNAYVSKEGDRDSLSMSFKQRSRTSMNQQSKPKQSRQAVKKQSPNKAKLSQSKLTNKMQSKDKNNQKSKSKIFNKNQQTQSPAKNQKSKSKSNKPQPSPKKQNVRKKNPDIGNQLYAKAMVRYKMQQNERQKRKQQLLAQQSKQLTFQPKINTVSSKIVQFRKQNGEQANKQKEKEKENKKLALNQQKEGQTDETKQCTFKPQINRVSELISQNRNAYKDQFDHFTVLYKQAQAKKERLNAKMNQEYKHFQPKINIKRSDSIKQTFQQRLEKSILRKNQIKEGLGDQEWPFKPKVGRPPKSSHNKTSKQESNDWWNQLHAQKLKNSQLPPSVVSQSQLMNQIPSINPNSNIYFENLIQKRAEEVFRTLDSDQDGIISPDYIAIERLTKNQLIFLKPLFQEIDEVQAYLDFTQFRKALILLLNESDVHSRGQFLTEKPRKQQKPSFTPQINKKSKQLAMTRIASGTQVFDQLYEKGLKQIQRKQYQNQRIRQQQQQQQMQQCSFKPLLNNTSKYYIDKVLGKKVSKFDLTLNDQN